MTLILPGLVADGYAPAPIGVVNELLAQRHYLGATRTARYALGQYDHDQLVAAQTWRTPAARHLPNDGSWLELSRWCLTPEAGANAGSRQHKWVVRWLRAQAPDSTTLVSYSDPSAGHTGSLYRACNWLWAPTWHRLRPPLPGTGHGRRRRAPRPSRTGGCSRCVPTPGAVPRSW